MVILLLGAFHQAQTLELGLNALHLFVLPRPTRFLAAKQEQIPLLRRIIPVLFVQIEQSGAGVLLPVVVSHAKGGQIDHALIPALSRVDGPFDVQIQNFSDAGAGFAHAVGIVEGEIGGRSRIGLPDAGVEQPQCRVHIADGAHCGAGVAA